MADSVLVSGPGAYGEGELLLQGVGKGSDGDDLSVHRQTTPVRAALSLVCACVGAGILSLPGVLQRAGWISLAMIVAIGIMSNYSAQRLGRCLLLIPGKRLRSYEEIGEAARGARGRKMVSIMNNLTLFGVATIFLIIVGANMSILVPSIKLRTWILITGCCQLPLAFLRSVHQLSFLASGGVLASVFTAIIIMVESVNNYQEVTIKPVTVFANVAEFPVAFNIILFSFGFHAVLPAIQDSMAEPQKINISINLALIIITLFYSLVAGFGYFGFGDDTEDNILVNFGNESIWANVGNAMIISNILVSYPIVLQPVALAIQAWWKDRGDEGTANPPVPAKYHVLVMAKLALTLLTVFIALVVPYFGPVLGLLSAIVLPAVGFVFPVGFYWDLLHLRGETLPRAHKAISVFIIVVASVGCILGIYFSMDDLINEIKKDGNPFSDFFDF